MNNLHIIICILFTIISNRKVIDGAKLPQKFHRCKVTGSNDYRPNKCLEEAVQHAILYLSDGGDPELGIPDLDPLRVNEIAIKPVSMEIVFKNIGIHGLSNYKLKSFEGNVSSPRDFKINIDGDVDSLQLIGDYSMKGKVLLFPVNGAGTCNLTFEGIRAGVKMTGEPFMKGDKEFVKIKDFQMSIDLDRAHFSSHNLFKDVFTNIFLTENWSEVYAELKPAIEEAIGQLFEEYTRRILKRIPYKDIFILD